ncbi:MULTISPECIES: helix-turn-helix domain-containing protein [Lachnospiraceae]|jgi:transcriptional regulator with XRE-family HTH domain|nr:MULTISPECIES: helix-turn-helix transcriptional regulator [Lachnospiraceae]
MVEFGEKLKRAREEKGMTQQTLSEYLYVTRQAVSWWEGGERYPIS